MTTTNHPAVELLRLLYGENPPGCRALWTYPDKTTVWVPASDYDPVAKWVNSLPNGADGYFGIGLHPQELGPDERGMADGVIAIPGVWADIDINGPTHAAKNLPTSMDEAEDFVREFPLQPTAIVDSGYGLHVYWAFRELWTWQKDDDKTRAAAQKLVRDFQSTLKAMAERHGWHVDTTSDLARVLRLPGTTNWKLANEPVPVRILDIQETCRYTPKEFEAHFLRPLSTNGHAPARELPEVIREERNNTLTSMAGTMRRRGFGEAAIREALLIENQERCDPPLPEAEVREIAHSVARYQPGRSRNVERVTVSVL